MSGWVRLWHDMPTDPKWRVIAKRSGRTISEVMSVFISLCVLAEKNNGAVDKDDARRAGAALGITPMVADDIFDAMEGKVLDNGTISEWRKIRPPSSAIGRLNANLWREIREKVFLRDNFTCSYCGQRGGKLECDHITPVSRGGSNDMGNLATACRECNRKKGAKTAKELGWWL